MPVTTNDTPVFSSRLDEAALAALDLIAARLTKLPGKRASRADAIRYAAHFTVVEMPDSPEFEPIKMGRKKRK